MWHLFFSFQIGLCVFLYRVCVHSDYEKLKKKMMATSNGRLHPIHYRNIFLSFVQKKKLQTLLPFSSAMRWDWRTTTPTKYDKSSPFMCEKIYYYFYWDQAFSCVGLTWFQHTLGQAMCVPFFKTLLVGDCWCFLSVFFFDANYLNGTHRPQVSTGIFYNTHTQQQHYESIYW